jgi:hypothetical protein
LFCDKRDKKWRVMMKRMLDSRQVPPHGMFYMESAGGCHLDGEEAQEEHQPSCFALEEEKGKCWHGTGSAGPLINEKSPTL